MFAKFFTSHLGSMLGVLSCIALLLTFHARAADDTVVLGGDEDFWQKVGIDPIQIMTGAGTFYTLRCYFDDRPIFLGRNGRISVFSSERALARYLADEHDHDLSDLSTYDDIRTAATDGSLKVNVTDDNIYVLTGLADDLADGPDAVDRDQLDLAAELLRDVGDYAEENTVDQALETDQPLGKDRMIFSGSLEQISDDVTGCANSGAREVFFDPAFAPQGQSLDYWLSLLEQLQGMRSVN